MKRKNASISNADILYNYVHNNCPRRFFIDFYGVFSILSTLFMLCGQIVDKLSSVDKFIIFSIFNNSLFYKGLRGYLPQQFLYFLPLPHVLSLSVYMVHIVYIVLLVFQAFRVLGTFNTYSIYSTYSIISIYLLRTICEHCSQYFILLINGYWTTNFIWFLMFLSYYIIFQKIGQQK